MGSLSRKAVWGAALALAILIPSASATAAERSSKLDRQLQEASSDSRRTVIVRVRRGARQRVLERYRRGHSQEIGLIDAVTTEVKGKELRELTSDPDVLSVSVDADVSATAYTASPAAAAASANMGASGTTSLLKRSLGIQDWFSGSSVTVAVIDSGIQNSIDFDGRIIASYDFTNGDRARVMKAVDEYGHGTHVAGLIGSSGASSGGKYAGIAPGVRLLSLKVLTKRGTGKTSDVIRALEFAVANKDRFDIKVINLSLGHPIYEPATSDPLVEAVEMAVRAGIVVVTAAGNVGTNPVTGTTGYAGILSPGNSPSAITVGASNTGGTTGRRDDRVAPYSSRGPSWYDGIAKPDVVAPGANLLSNEVDGSTLAETYPNLVVRDKAAKLLRLNGTSMAAGVVTGLVASMLDANNYGGYLRAQMAHGNRKPYTGVPALTPNAVKAMLQYSATPLRDAAGLKYDALTQGSGEVNGYGALALAGAANTGARAGTFWMSVSWPTQTSFGGVDEEWSQSVVWGTRVLQGSSLIDINQGAWASNIVWGTGTLGKVVVRGTVADDNIVWGTFFGGDNIVWGTFFGGNVSFGDNIVWGTAMSWDDNIVWGTNLLGLIRGTNIVWGTRFDANDNIVWGTLSDDNIVWGTFFDDNIVWGTADKVLGLVSSIGGGL
jgi:serine protease AprX